MKKAMSALLLLAALQEVQAQDAPKKPVTHGKKPIAKAAPAKAAGDQDAGAKPKSDVTDLDIGDLMKVEVTTASKKAQPLSAVPAAIYVITGDDIRRSGATNIPEALRLAPGLQVQQLDNQKYAVSIRGFASRYDAKLLVLIDGRSIYNPEFSGVFWEQEMVMLEDVDRIEVIRGPGGALWGANAVDGIINIITKQAKDTQKSLLVAGGGSKIGGIGSYRYGGEMTKDSHYRVYAMNRTVNHSTTAAGVNAQDGYDINQGGFRGDWGEGSKSRFSLSSDYYEDHLGGVAAIPILTAPYSIPFVGAQPVSEWDMVGKWDRDLSEKSSTSLQMFYDHFYRGSITPGQQDSTDTLDLDFQNQLTLTNNYSLTWGAGYRHITNEVTPESDFTLIPPRREIEVYSVFVHNDLDLGRHMKLTSGIKLEHNNFTGFEIQPNLKFAWTPDAKRTLWASVSRAVRTPSIWSSDLRWTIAVLPPGGQVPAPIAEVIQGNKFIGSEKLVASELGYRWQATDRLFVDVAGFYNVYDHLTEVVLSGTPVPAMSLPAHLVIPLGLTARNDGQTYGAELTGTYKASKSWRVALNYSYLGASLFDNGSVNGVNSPQHQVNFRSNLDLRHDLEFDTMVYFTGKIPALAMPNMARLDLRLGWHPTKALELSIAGYNVLNEHHQDAGSQGTTLVDRSVYGKATWKF